MRNRLSKRCNFRRCNECGGNRNDQMHYFSETHQKVVKKHLENLDKFLEKWIKTDEYRKLMDKVSRLNDSTQ